jgi:thiol-disulfide isomerase/thioredoxin
MPCPNLLSPDERVRGIRAFMSQELTDATFKAALDAAPLAFVDLYASWCGPCRLFSPLFDQVAARHPQAKFFKIDGDLNPGL